jgi:hypothetical protein
MSFVWAVFCNNCDLRFLISKGEPVEMPADHKIKLICPYCLHRDMYGLEDLMRSLYSPKMAC